MMIQFWPSGVTKSTRHCPATLRGCCCCDAEGCDCARAGPATAPSARHTARTVRIMVATILLPARRIRPVKIERGKSGQLDLPCGLNGSTSRREIAHDGRTSHGDTEDTELHASLRSAEPTDQTLAMSAGNANAQHGTCCVSGAHHERLRRLAARDASVSAACAPKLCVSVS